MTATQEDAALVVQLARWGTEMGLQDAGAKIFADEFDVEEATAADPPVRTILSFGEIIGTLVKRGLLDRELVLDLWSVRLAWSRVGSAALRDRKRLDAPRLYENFEALATASPTS